MNFLNFKFQNKLLQTTKFLFKDYKRLMDSLQGKQLVDPHGKTVQAKSIIKRKKYVVYYFSASWCTHCQQLLPQIKKIYELNCKEKLGFEIIYISLDTEKDTMMKYFKEKHGGWYAIPFGDPAIEELRLRFGVTHIPYLVVVKSDGTIISKEARKEIEELGVNVLVTWAV